MGNDGCPPAYPSSTGGTGDLYLPPHHQGGQWGVCARLGPPRVGEGGLCLHLRAAGSFSPNKLITRIFPPIIQCLDGIDYDDFNFVSPMVEQKEPLIETGKGPSDCALPGVPSCSGVSQQADSLLVFPSSTTGCVPTGPTVSWLGIPTP